MQVSSTGRTAGVLLEPGLDAVPVVGVLTRGDATDLLIPHLFQTDDAVIVGLVLLFLFLFWLSLLNELLDLFEGVLVLEGFGLLRMYLEVRVPILLCFTLLYPAD